MQRGFPVGSIVETITLPGLYLVQTILVSGPGPNNPEQLPGTFRLN